MEFRWNDWNVQHIADHGVDPEEVEEAVANSPPFFPQHRGDDKWLSWGRGRGGRPIQVVFVLDADGTAFAIHARAH